MTKSQARKFKPIFSGDFFFTPNQEYYQQYQQLNPKRISFQNYLQVDTCRRILKFIKISEENATMEKVTKSFENKLIQKKIINIISDYQKIPDSLIKNYQNYLQELISIINQNKNLNNKSKINDLEFNNLELNLNTWKDSQFITEINQLSDSDFKIAFINYLRNQYNQYSLLDMDVEIIFFTNWKKNFLTDHQPRKIIIQELENLILYKLKENLKENLKKNKINSFWNYFPLFRS